MALAPFFDKAALAAAAVLQGFDRERFAAVLEAHRVGIAFDEQAAISAEGRLTLTLAVNLAARLYPTLVLVPCGERAVRLCPALSTLARMINPSITLVSAVHSAEGSGSSTGTAPTICVVVGATAASALGVAADTRAVYAGSAGWLALLSSCGPVSCGDTALPFGAGAAACLSMAKVFRHVFAAQLPGGDADEELALSTLTLETGADARASDVSGTFTVDITGTVLVGVGAVGQGVLWALTRTPGLCGELEVVDDQQHDLSNIQRYILTAMADVNSEKADVALRPDSPPPGDLPPADPAMRLRRPLERGGLQIVPHAQTWGQFLAGRQAPWRLPRILVALDSARDRIAVQASLPAWVANAWTQPGDLGVSRHRGLEPGACLACLYVPTERAKNEDELVAEAVGLVGELLLVRKLLATNQPVDEALLGRMADGLGVPLEPLLQFAGRSLRIFYSQAICAGVVLRLQSKERGNRSEPHGNGADGGEAANSVASAAPPPHNGRPTDRGAMVPMAFQSALAGILLGAALVAEVVGLPAPEPGMKAVLNVLGSLGQRLLVPVAKHPSGRCLCQDADVRAAFAASLE